MSITEFYLKEFAASKERFIEYPAGIHIETTGRCQARCETWPHDRSPRKHMDMSDELFEKILTDLAEIPSDRHVVVTPGKLGEPMLDRYIARRITRISEAVPQAKIRLHTNLNFLPPHRLAELQQGPMLDNLWVSLMSLDPKKYKKITGMRLSRTVNNIHRLIEANKEKPFIKDLMIGRLANMTDDDTTWEDKCYKTFGPNMAPKQLTYGNWVDEIKSPCEVIREDFFLKLPCIHWFDVSICCDGKVSLCCMDGLCEYPIGDITQNSVLEIYNNPEFRQLREKLSTREMAKPCHRCTFL